MAELKPIEVVMLIDFASSNGIEVIAHAERVCELVRCKDCKWHEWYIRSRLMDGKEYESNECRKFNMAVTPNWFCADGKRKETEDE